MTAIDLFWKPYTQRAMKFLQDNRADILAYSQFLGVDTDAVAASILREITGVDEVYRAHDLPQTILRASVTLDTATGSLSGLPGTDFDLNARILADYQSTLNDHSWYLIRSINYATGLSFTQFDIGPGKIRIDLAVDLIKEYLLSNSYNDVLGLKKYDGHFDQMFYDMYDDPSLTVKLAALVIKRGQAYFVGPDAAYDTQRYSGGAQAQWNAYTPEQRTALLVKYYATGPENLTKEVSNKNFESYDLDTHGSNITLFQNNLSLLQQVLGDTPSSDNFVVNFPSPDNMKIDRDKGNLDGSGLNLELFSYPVLDSIGNAAAINGIDVGEVRIDSLKSLTLSKFNDTIVSTNDTIQQNYHGLTIDAADGNDTIIIKGGSNITVIGGAGRDFIYNHSAGGIIYGDLKSGFDTVKQKFISQMELDGSDLISTGTDASGKPILVHQYADYIWWSSDTTVMDAGRFDHLSFFGVPLTGGDTSGGISGQVQGGVLSGLLGVAIGASQTYTKPTESTFLDYIIPAILYKLDYTQLTNGRPDLLVINQFDKLTALIDDLVAGSIPNPDKGILRIKNFDFVGSYIGNQQASAADLGTFGMVFKKANPIWEILSKLPDTAIQVGLTGGGNAFGPLADQTATWSAYVTRTAKANKWATGGDPLVLDLSGRGLNTTQLYGSNIHFDLNNDFFSERTGWIGSGAGLLALDKNGNSKIDDVTELFGSYTGSGLGDLAAYDLNHDGKVDSADAVYAKLRVWQDTNGVTVTVHLIKRENKYEIQIVVRFVILC